MGTVEGVGLQLVMLSLKLSSGYLRCELSLPPSHPFRSGVDVGDCAPHHQEHGYLEWLKSPVLVVPCCILAVQADPFDQSSSLISLSCSEFAEQRGVPSDRGVLILGPFKLCSLSCTDMSASVLPQELNTTSSQIDNYVEPAFVPSIDCFKDAEGVRLQSARDKKHI